MQPQGGSYSGGVSRAWQGLASVLCRSDVGSATLLAYCDLWFSLGAKPGCLDLTLHAWGASFGRSPRAADKWLGELERHHLVEVLDRRFGKIRLYVVDPGDVGKPRRFDGDPQQALPGFDEEESPADAPAALALGPAEERHVVDRDALAAGPACDDSDVSAHKRPTRAVTSEAEADVCAHKRPSELDEVEALNALLRLHRIELARGEPPQAARLGVGPLRAETSEGAQKGPTARRVQELRAQSSSINKKPEELRALSSAQTSESDVCAQQRPSAAAASPVDRVLARASPDAAEAHHRRRDALIARVLAAIESLKPSVARNVVDGVLRGLFEWSDVERMIERARDANVPWQYFVGAAKQKYRDVKAPWPSGHRRGGAGRGP